MTSGWGVDATLSNGVPVGGTSDLDVRKVWGSLYSAGVISGCAVTTSPTQMKYTVASGVVAIKTATGEAVMAPVQGASVVASAAPSTGTRKDIVYAIQRFPSIEGDSNVALGVGTTLPVRAVALATYTVSAGDTNTNQAVRSGSVDYSIPYGANLGVLYTWQHKFDGVLPNSLTRYGNGTFYLPTDRNVKFSLSACISAQGATGFDNSKYSEYGFLPNIDNGDFILWATPGMHQAWQLVNFSHTIQVSAGEHAVKLGFTRLVGPGNVLCHYGTDSLGYGRTGVTLTIEDVGPVA